MLKTIINVIVKNKSWSAAILNLSKNKGKTMQPLSIAFYQQYK